MDHGFAQCCIDAGLPTSLCSLEGFENIGIHAHVQSLALHSSGKPATTALDTCLLPIGCYDRGIIGVIKTIGGSM